MPTPMRRALLALLVLLFAAVATGCNDDGDPATDAANDTASDTGADSGDSSATDAGCSATQLCGMGMFCNDKGNCCPALGCNPQCPNGPLLDANGCDTCQCAP